MNDRKAEHEPEPLASHEFASGGLEQALEFLKRTRSELRMLRRARVWERRFRVYDVNGDCFEIVGVGYPDGEIVPILNAVNANFLPATIHEPPKSDFKEFKTGRRYPWAADRVM